jgi:hypothetical protein
MGFPFGSKWRVIQLGQTESASSDSAFQVSSAAISTSWSKDGKRTAGVYIMKEH